MEFIKLFIFNSVVSNSMKSTDSVLLSQDCNNDENVISHLVGKTAFCIYSPATKLVYAKHINTNFIIFAVYRTSLNKYVICLAFLLQYETQHFHSLPYFQSFYLTSQSSCLPAFNLIPLLLSENHI